jgi:hypothetical protein
MARHDRHTVRPTRAARRRKRALLAAMRAQSHADRPAKRDAATDKADRELRHRREDRAYLDRLTATGDRVPRPRPEADTSTPARSRWSR